MADNAELHRILLLLALNTLLTSLWLNSPPNFTCSGRSLMLLMLLMLLYFYSAELQTLLLDWYKRNIVKGDSAFIHALHVKNDEQIIRLGKNEFSVADPAILDTIYKDRSFLKSEQYAAFDVDGNATLFSMRDPAEHARRHKAVAHLFKSPRVVAKYGMIGDLANRFCDYIQDSLEKDSSVDVLQFMRGFSVQSISLFALGLPLCEVPDEPALGKQVGLYIDAINKSARFGRSSALIVRWADALSGRVRTLLGKTPGPDADTEKAFSMMDAFCARVARQTESAAYRDHLWQGSSLDHKALEAELADLLFAGTDSTSVTLSLGLHYIYTNKYILDKLFNEVRDADMSRLWPLPYLDAVIDESLRLALPVPRRLPRVVPFGKDIFYKEDKLDDGWEKIIPATATVGMSAYTLHRNKVFKDPLKFQPERWFTPKQADGGQLLSWVTEYSKMRQCFVPFGKGVRACIGQELARQELRTMLATFVKRFDGESVGERPRCDDNFNATIQGSVVLLKLRRRSAAT
ncbi:cytochrome P450 [Protomyces lactucae-debilis]|uniref:Cytochrome P450 n=1 Tax=Protomyces lactucae-debilis TaxID=2754530 RepID=A0A1Y2FSV0_PROLT|nr:cytochrome P450 [Protomyces lactucae-debilis]ORY87048.1 cytochrome P450 [Protomyces lactucae-debilis]